MLPEQRPSLSRSRTSLSLQEKDYMRILPAPTLETSKSTKKSTSSTGTSKSRMQRAEVMADTKFSAMGTLSPFMNAVGLPKELRSNIVKKIGCGAGHFTGLTGRSLRQISNGRILCLWL